MFKKLLVHLLIAQCGTGDGSVSHRRELNIRRVNQPAQGHTAHLGFEAPFLGF